MEQVIAFANTHFFLHNLVNLGFCFVLFCSPSWMNVGAKGQNIPSAKSVAVQNKTRNKNLVYLLPRLSGCSSKAPCQLWSTWGHPLRQSVDSWMVKRALDGGRTLMLFTRSGVAMMMDQVLSPHNTLFSFGGPAFECPLSNFSVLGQSTCHRKA